MLALLLGVLAAIIGGAGVMSRHEPQDRPRDQYEMPQTLLGGGARATRHFTDFVGADFQSTKDDPEYLVESEKTGAKAAHKPEALKPAK